MKPQVVLHIDRIACDGRGTCAELLPELIALDDWGYPIIADGLVHRDLESLAHAAVELCPKLALQLRTSEGEAAREDPQPRSPSAGAP